MRTVLVGNKPFIAIAGEAHNSSSSSAEYMLDVWEKAKAIGLNTLLLPATWELIEPVEGCFDFSLIDEIICQARERNMRIIFLWFGTWKNAQSTYAPEWVKVDLIRFPRAEVIKGKKKVILEEFYDMPYTSLSYLGEETCKADANAFSHFMRHLKEFDQKYETVIAVQVENETGLQGADREHSDLADRLFGEKVPKGLISYMKANWDLLHPDIKNALDGNDSGSWLEVFNEQAGEIFSAYCIASYVEKVASAGKAEYDLPLFVNCWLDNGGRAGFYPSGGPIAKVMEVWKYVAKSIDFYAPDIYVKDFVKICQDYTKLGNPLFIPETATHSHCAPRLVYSIGHHHATCFAPFGFEDMGLPFTNSQAALFGVDVTDPLLAQPQSAEEYRWCADNLGGMMNLLTAAYGTKKLQATISEGNSRRLEFDKFGFSISMDNPYIIRTDGVCLILQIDENSFYVMANACVIDCFSLSKDEPNVDLLAVDEGEFVAGEFVKGRRLNGDETASLKFENFGLVRLKLFAYGE